METKINNYLGTEGVLTKLSKRFIYFLMHSFLKIIFCLIMSSLYDLSTTSLCISSQANKNMFLMRLRYAQTAQTLTG